MRAETRHAPPLADDEEATAPLRLLVSGVAHQVRNPLFGMSAAIDAFELRLGPSDDHAAFFAVLRGQIARVGAVVQDLIDYAEPAPMTLCRGNVAAIVHDAVDRCLGPAQRRAVTFEVSGEPPPGAAAIDATRLAEAIVRLLADALEHAPRGSRVTVTMEGVTREQRPWFQCTIGHDGPSFTEEELRRAFDPFFPRRRAAGGLGLAIASRVVLGHGGALETANRAGGGAMTTLRLPWLSSGSAWP